ncbi:unnamed protein product, partial [Staurois parvus]
MALGRKKLTCGAIKELTLCVCVRFTVSTLLYMALLCKAMHGNVQELT